MTDLILKVSRPKGGHFDGIFSESIFMKANIYFEETAVLLRVRNVLQVWKALFEALLGC